MKNILIISQHIFPIQTPRSLRTTELVKEFSRQGHNVVVYAVLGKYDYNSFEKKYNCSVKAIPTNFQISPYSSDGINKRTFIDKVLGKLLGKTIEFPDIEFLFSIPKIIRNEKKFDLLISIANPHPIHWACAKAKLKTPNKFPLKWIADCGDPFMKNGKSNKRFYFEKHERQFSKHCDFITVPIKGAKEAYYKEYHYKIKMISQGFKFELPLKETIVNNKVLTFAFTGVFIEDIRNPKLFFEYLLTLKQNFKFIIYTQHTNLIDSYISKLGNKIEIRKYIKREKLLEVLKTMDFLLNIENIDSPNQLPSKLIDYSIANRPILSINPRDLNINKIDSFFNNNYSKKLIVKNIENYHISNIVKQFIEIK